MTRLVTWLACLGAVHSGCATRTVSQAGGAPTASLRQQAPCESKAERDAQAAHACLTSTPADAPISIDRVRPFLAALCVPNERDGRVGCAGCAPDFTTSSMQPDALAEVSRFIEGSFTSAGASEVLLTFDACEARQASPPLILLRRQLGQFRRVDALPPDSSGRCAASAAVHGYSRLVCAGSAADHTGASSGEDTWLDVLDLHLRRYSRLVGIRNTRRAACADGQREVLREFGVVEAGFRDLDGDGLEDVWIRALWSTGPEPQRYDTSCRDLFQPRDDWMTVQAELRALACELPDTRCGTLEFLAKGDGFRPTFATARTLKTLDSTSSDTATTF